MRVNKTVQYTHRYARTKQQQNITVVHNITGIQHDKFFSTFAHVSLELDWNVSLFFKKVQRSIKKVRLRRRRLSLCSHQKLISNNFWQHMRLPAPITTLTMEGLGTKARGTTNR